MREGLETRLRELLEAADDPQAEMQEIKDWISHQGLMMTDLRAQDPAKFSREIWDVAPALLEEAERKDYDPTGVDSPMDLIEGLTP